MVKSVLVLGAGSAGLMAALAVKRRLPDVAVRIVRSPEISVIGVGESTTPNVPLFLFDYLGISPRKFFELAEPTWKLGIHFLWGPRESFNYSFEPAMDARLNVLPRPNGYYCDEHFTDMNLGNALMHEGKAFARRTDGGGPDITGSHAFHLENTKFVRALEFFAIERGIEFTNGKLQSAERSDDGISAIVLEDGSRLTADYFIDASGFRSELLEKVLAEPFLSFDRSLFNDRAVLGSWDRTNEPTLPYTTAETMDCGWAWRIDHERIINRGYVYSSSHISDEAARAEFAAKNPKAKIADKVVRFRSGRHRNSWVGNVMAIGNAYGFVEPLEATALMMICVQAVNFTDFLMFVGETPSVRELYNLTIADLWDEIRDFIALHYKFNTRIDTPYWRHCRNETDISGSEKLLSFYNENGPTNFNRAYLRSPGSKFGIEGFLVILVGNKVACKNRYVPTDSERRLFDAVRTKNRMTAKAGLTVEQSLAYIRHPNWRWASEA